MSTNQPPATAPTDEMVLAALNAEYREQYRSWGRVDPETGEVQWEDRTRLDEFAPSVPRKTRAALSAALAVAPPDAARPWELLNGPVRVGDKVRQDHDGVTSIAIVGRVDVEGDPWTTEGAFVGVLDEGTWYVRRTAPELPTEDGAVIERADGHKYITAIFDGETYRAREAVLGRDGWWYGVWRRATPAPHVDTSVAPDHITPGTWQETRA